MKLETFIAFRYLYSAKKSRAMNFITNISIVGVTIGVMALIVVLSIMNGFEEDLKKALIGTNAHLTLSSFSQSGEQKIIHNQKTINKIQLATGAKHISPYTIDQALISHRKKVQGILLKGIDIKKEISGGILRELIKLENTTGINTTTSNELTEVLQDLKLQERVNKKGNKENIAGIILGAKLAKILGLKRKDTLTILTTQQKISPFGVIPQKRKFIVSGFFTSGLSGYDEVFTLIDLQEAARLFGHDKYVNAYAIYLEQIKNTAQKQKKLLNEFFFPHTITSWIDDNYNLFAVLKLEKLGLSIILFLIILVATFNIISSLVILVSEKTKDIAILKAIGTSDNSIRNIFLLQGSIIGSFGTSLGTLLGLVICIILKKFSFIKIPQGVYVSNNIPILIDPWQIVTILIISLISCFLVTYFPAKKAAQQSPVIGLKL